MYATITDAIREHGRNAANADPAKCVCRGMKYWLSDYDTWETCSLHRPTDNDPHPEDHDND